MDKNWKLQRYTQKDYAEVVDFPVEIVGRDGVVRRYRFEDSIRLYQRRITFAPARYRDVELIRAEVSHCRARIDQLRRSYFHRHGWGTPEGAVDPEALLGDLAGEVAAFLRRFLGCTGRPDVTVTPLEEDDTPSSQRWFVRSRLHDEGMLLMLHRFEGTEAEANREAFFNRLKDLERSHRPEGDGERLLAFHHTMDCGLILTGRAGAFTEVPEAAEDEAESASDRSQEPTCWDYASEAIRRGDYGEALRHCQQVVAEQPWHRRAYIAGTVLATALARPVDAEELALLGARHFPDDGVLHFYLGIARLAQGRTDDASTDLVHALESAPSLAGARLLLAVVYLRRFRYNAAHKVLVAGEGVEPDDRRAGRSLDKLTQRMQARRRLMTGAVAAFVIGGLLCLINLLVGALFMAIGAGVAATVEVAFREYLQRVAEQQRFDDVAAGLRRVSPRPRPEEPRVC